jgi:lipopolysaccharide export system permease protein
MRLFDRYILRELRGPFLFSVFLFGSLLVSGRLLFQLIDLIVKQNVAPTVALQLFALQLPEVVGFTFPMSVLLGTLLCLNRLSADSEAIALFAGGANLFRLSIPVSLFAGAVFAAALLLSEYVSPQCLSRAEQLKLEHISKANITRQNLIAQEGLGRDTRVIYARSFDLKHMEMRKVAMLELSDGEPHILFTAERAQYHRPVGWRFYSGTIQSVGRRNSPQSPASFGEAGFAVNITQTPEQLARKGVDPEALTIAQLRAVVARMEAAGQNVNELRVKLSDKVSMPFSCITFGLLGVALGVSKGRSKSAALGFGLAVLLIFSYWVIWLSLGILGQSGRLTPSAASWGANAILLLVALCLIARKSS